MKLLVLCALIGAAVAATTTPWQGETELTQGSHDFQTEMSECSNSGRYLYFKDAKHWADAQLHCQTLGGTLAVIHTSQENDLLKNLAKGMPAWIGFSDAQHEGIWLWINGDRLSYTDWCYAEPDNVGGKQDCAIINSTGNKCWDDQDCKTAFPFICQMK
ncbi:hypothetical protein NL108_012952 [Boleophthalmus pectinirostris]|uniref:lactose-binding lectin l-2-like n=1 Tax=Boleophthalmus pectinirostris TaxID=150288 RepID=UPI000A1C5882|nr:lactose-binding lectin l-2-like [Boleophthalmus pectinirostris]KAJ0070497.1 hypothetical protein NL108_012952 [Boleophthalmus pectinirostris]